MSDYAIRPGERIKIGRDLARDGYVLPIGSMGTVVFVGETSAQVRFDAPPVEVTLDLDAEPFWIELNTCSGYSLREDSSPDPKD